MDSVLAIRSIVLYGKKFDLFQEAEASLNKFRELMLTKVGKKPLLHDREGIFSIS